MNWQGVKAWYETHGFHAAADDMRAIKQARRHPELLLQELWRYDNTGRFSGLRKNQRVKQ